MRAERASEVRSFMVGMMRALPRIRGHGRLASALNKWTLRKGVSPVATATMNLGHRLILDCRVPAHVQALYRGDYDDARIRVLAELLEPGGCFLDAGANIGFYSVPLGLVAKCRGARVVAVEPLLTNVNRLRGNLELNNVLDVVVVMGIGLSSEARCGELVLREDFAEGSTVGNASVVIEDGQDTEFKRTKVTLARLDDLWSSLSAERLDIAKLDVEGHEDLVLKGGRATVARFRPVILVEANLFYYRRRGVDFGGAIRAQLPEGYRFFRMAKPRVRFRTGDKARTLSETFEIRQSDAGLFLVPNEKVGALHRALSAVRHHPFQTVVAGGALGS